MRISDWSSDVCSSDLALIGVCGLVGLLSSAGTWAVVWAGVIGFASAFILIWTLALPPMIAARDEVHRMRSEEHTSELQSLMRISYAVFCLKKKRKKSQATHDDEEHHTKLQHKVHKRREQTG